MSILPQLEQDLLQAAQERLPEAADDLPGRHPLRRALGIVVPAAGAAVALAITVLVLVLVPAHRRPAPRSTAGEPSTGQAVAGEQLYGKARGGTLTVRSAASFENLDPGEAYAFANDYAVDDATQRPLFSYLPNDPSQVVADLASEVPTTANGGISDDGKTVTVHLRRGVHSAPPSTARSPRRTWRTRSSAAPTRTSPTRTSRPILDGAPTLRSRALRLQATPAARSRESRSPTRTRSCSTRSSRPARSSCRR